MSSLRCSESVVVACAPEVLYDMVSDVTQIADRTLAGREGIPLTLAALKRSAESA